MFKKIKKIKWYITGHLVWHKGSWWNKHIEKFGVYGESAPKSKIISKYEFWVKYSPINGC